jgi:transposase
MTSERLAGTPRIAEPVRNQCALRFEIPEDALPPTHPARVLWDVTGTLDLSRFLVGIKAVEGTAGRRALSPRMKLTLWLYAVSQGVAHGRSPDSSRRSTTRCRRSGRRARAGS